MLQVGIFGASGRMGSLLIQEVSKDENLQLSSVYARDNIQELYAQNLPVAKTIKDFLDSCACIIDFSSKEGSLELMQTAKNHHIYKPMVIGTTGFSQEEFDMLQALSTHCPILYASNMSMGVAILAKISAIVAQTLKDSDIEIVEYHHRHKKDAPSGTALTLAQACAEARGLDLQKVRVSGRDGIIGARSKDEIGVMSIRGGDVVGKHNVGFYLDGEYLELTHNATSRLTFVKGAICALKWLATKPNGLYTIQDSLGLNA